MKAFFQSILSISLGLLILSCETDKESVNPGPEPSGQSATGAVTPIGVSEGAVTTAQIGPSARVDNGALHTYTVGMNGNGGQHRVVGREEALSCTFSWTKSTDVAFNLNKPKLIYQQIYGKALTVSGGFARGYPASSELGSCKYFN